MMTRKKKNFADKLIANPQMSQAEAARQTYNIGNPKGASALGSKLAKDKDILEYITKNAPYAEKTIVKVMKNALKDKTNNQWQRLALDSANSVLDRSYGKSIQRTEVHSSSVNLNLSLSGVTGVEEE